MQADLGEKKIINLHRPQIAVRVFFRAAIVFCQYQRASMRGMLSAHKTHPALLQGCSGAGLYFTASAE